MPTGWNFLVGILLKRTMVEFPSVLTKIKKYLTPPVILFLFSAFSYGVMIPLLGFYWDDYPLIWFKHAFGSKIFLELFTSDRPFLAGVYLITTNLLGSTPFPWHILAIISRWLVSWLLFWSLTLLWPNRPVESLWTAALFTVYPGFLQQPISVVYSNGLLLFAGYLLSIGMMIKAIRSPTRYWYYTSVAIAGYVFCTFSTEYYVTLDAIRPVIIWFIVASPGLPFLQNLRQVIRHWLPYLIPLAIYLVWRIVIFQFPGYQPKMVEEVAGTNASLLFGVLERIILDSFTAGIQPWLAVFNHFVQNLTLSATSVAYLLLVFATLAISLLIFIIKENPVDIEHTDDIHWRSQAVVLGLVALLAAGGPFIIADLPIKLVFPWDRFTLPFMMGSAIFLIGVLDWLIRLRMQRLVIVCMLVSLATGFHFSNSNSYRREWETKKSFFWQLVWRAPGLSEGTSIVTHTLPLNYYSDNSLTAPLNWTYFPDSNDPDLPLVFIYTQVRLGSGLPDYLPDLPIKQHYRTASFSGTTSESLVIFFSPPGCLHILSPQYFNEVPFIPEELKRAVIISHPDQIITNPVNPAQPPLSIFGAEPERDWCYYYVKADLARQTGDWSQVIALAENAFSQDLNPKDASELIPFIEGYANMADFERARQLSRSALENNPALLAGICDALQRVYQSSSQPTAPLESLISDLSCPIPGEPGE